MGITIQIFFGEFWHLSNWCYAYLFLFKYNVTGINSACSVQIIKAVNFVLALFAKIVQIAIKRHNSVSDKLNKDVLEKEKESYPLGYGIPTDVANAVVFLLSASARWVTGTEIILDGGCTLK